MRIAKTKTHETFISEINQNIELLNRYEGATKPMTCKCRVCNHVWSVKNAGGLLRTGCPNCSGNIRLTHELFLEKVSLVLNGNVQIIGTYINANTPIECKCNVCDYVWFALPTNLLGGSGCKRCNDITGGLKRRKTHSQFLDELIIINPNIEVIEEYVVANKKINCRCKICNHIWSPTASSLLCGYGCPKCSGNYTTEEEFLNSFKKNGSDNVKLLSSYIDCKTKIKCICLICKYEWSATPYQLKNGVGCKRCADKKRGLNTRLTQEEFISRVSKNNPNVDVIGLYITTNESVECKCKKCGHVWSPNAYAIMTSTGCPNCSTSKGEENISLLLQNYNINYFSQKTFQNLLGVGNRPLSYDFYLPQYNLLIEFQGKQHEQPIEHFGGEEKFKIQQEHDNRKREYAKLNNINLLEIWYYDIDNIESILLQKINEIKENNLNLESVETVTVA